MVNKKKTEAKKDMLDGYKKIIAFIVSLAISIVAYFGLGGALPLVQNIIPLAILGLGGAYISIQGNEDKKKILATPIRLRGDAVKTPLEQYTQIFIWIITLGTALITYFVQDPAKVTSYTQFITQVIQPLGIMILGFVFSGVASAISSAKVTGTVVTPAVVNNKIDVDVPVIEVPVTPESVYIYADVNAIADKIKNSYKADNVLDPAYEFYRQTNMFELSRVRAEDRVKQSKEFVDKSNQLFGEAFVKYTNLPLPTLSELTNRPALLFKLKRDYEKANNLGCSGKTFTELNMLLGFMDDFVNYYKGFDLIGKESASLNWGNLRAGYNPFDVCIYAGSLVNENKSIIAKKPVAAVKPEAKKK